MSIPEPRVSVPDQSLSVPKHPEHPANVTVYAEPVIIMMEKHHYSITYINHTSFRDE